MSFSFEQTTHVEEGFSPISIPLLDQRQIAERGLVTALRNAVGTVETVQTAEGRGQPNNVRDGMDVLWRVQHGCSG